MTGFGIPAWDGEAGREGTSMQDVRLITQGMFQSFGVLRGGTVTTDSAGLTYHVAPGVGVLQRSTAYGAVLFPIPAGDVTTTAGPSSGTRTDLVWAAQHDPSQGDTDGNVVLGVGQSLPTGAIELARFTVPAGMATTSQATVAASQTFAIPYGASVGVLHRNVHTYDGPADTDHSHVYTEQNGSFFLPTDRWIEFRMRASISTADWGNTSKRGSWFFGFMLDGAVFNGTEVEYTNVFANHEYSAVVIAGAGTHTVAVQSHALWGDQGYFHYGSASQFCGRVFEVWDRGAAA